MCTQEETIITLPKTIKKLLKDDSISEVENTLQMQSHGQHDKCHEQMSPLTNDKSHSQNLLNQNIMLSVHINRQSEPNENLINPFIFDPNSHGVDDTKPHQNEGVHNNSDY
ncbi:hypothetical protein M153_4180003580 [Pseudoloma neurophilia]|uniref:Uncharacterized protein n=1 Tax=Pseudoloma neurophilia TaxID=146866 RepID=A0A0R0LXH5_9MICR|nr:hypothetical protein M153_4180003580 [Pseudoloma neurophilia]